MALTQGDWETAADALVSASTIGVVGHVRPDGDALGAMLGLVHAARAAGKDAMASFGEPFVLGNEFDYLDLSVLTPPGQFPDDLDLAVVCDTGVIDRLGSIGPRVLRASKLLVIDHHKSGNDIGDFTLIDPTAAATTQLVYQLLVKMGWPITRAVADALYTGLVTDTGRFMYSATTPEVHRIAAELIESGVEPAPIGQHLFESAPFGYFSVVSEVLGRAVLDEEAGLVWSVLTADDVKKAGVTWEATDGIIDMVRLAEEADTTLLLKEVGEDTLKGSLRSRGAVDVAAVAGTFGGGGHHNAAGFTATGTVSETVAKITELLS
ncbi:MAG: bifunctional oligoribonuclease/PAP phosphatase NrnA [Acidimicrobiia bacterium]|nr:MAG: bifunctional oligoribonuclease/PAP phosphatase NrnA [Acidimicrobiia bacterium]